VITDGLCAHAWTIMDYTMLTKVIVVFVWVVTAPYAIYQYKMKLSWKKNNVS